MKRLILVLFILFLLIHLVMGTWDRGTRRTRMPRVNLEQSSYERYPELMGRGLNQNKNQDYKGGVGYGKNSNNRNPRQDFYSRPKSYDMDDYDLIPDMGLPGGDHNLEKARGHSANLGQFPYVAGIRLRHTGVLYCVGSVISNRWVLSTAYCVRAKTGFDILISLGTIDRAEYGKVYEVKSLKGHPLYNRNTRNYDISLLETMERINFNKNIRPIQIATLDDEYIANGMRLTTIGFGRLTRQKMYDPLVWLPFTVSDNIYCKSTFKNIADHHLCSVSNDMCFAESGAPVIYEDRLTAIRVTNKQCDSKKPFLLLHVSHFTNWISMTTQGDVTID